MFEGDLRGWRGRSPAGSLETRLKAGGVAGAAGFWEALWVLGSARQAGTGLAFTGHPCEMQGWNPSSGEREPPTRAPCGRRAGFVSGAAPPPPAGS